MGRGLSAEQVEAYRRDGVIHVPQAVAPHWVDRLLGVIDRQLRQPSKWANDASPGNVTDRLFTDRYQWREQQDIRAYIYESGVAQLAAQAMGSSTARFYFDHLLVKEPKTRAVTPWHQDVPYWPVKGRQICSVWLALTDATVADSAMEFVRGSHLDGNYYLPQLFGERDDHPSDWIRQGDGVPVPEIEQHREQYDIVGWDVRAGDALVFSAWTLHWAPGNASSDRRRAALSTRWLGDDAVWHPHPGADPTVTQDDVTLRPGEPVHDDDVFPQIWPA